MKYAFSFLLFVTIVSCGGKSKLCEVAIYCNPKEPGCNESLSYQDCDLLDELDKKARKVVNKEGLE